MTDTAINPVEVKRVNVWVERAAYAILIAFFTIALLFCTKILYDTYFNSPPVNITSLDGTVTREFCPGDNFDVHNHVQVTKPIFLYIYSSVMVGNLSQNVDDTQDSWKPRPHPINTMFDQVLKWKIPPLPPGKYYRVITYRGYVDSEKPVFVYTPFIVKERCTIP